jgi:hypothetical protein
VAKSILLSTFLPFLLWFGTACPFIALFSFTLCAGFFEECFVVVAWWSYIVLASAYLGRLLLLYLF